MPIQTTWSRPVSLQTRPTATRGIASWCSRCPSGQSQCDDAPSTAIFISFHMIRLVCIRKYIWQHVQHGLITLPSQLESWQHKSVHKAPRLDSPARAARNQCPVLVFWPTPPLHKAPNTSTKISHCTAQLCCHTAARPALLASHLQRALSAQQCPAPLTPCPHRSHWRWQTAARRRPLPRPHPACMHSIFRLHSATVPQAAPPGPP